MTLKTVEVWTTQCWRVICDVSGKYESLMRRAHATRCLSCRCWLRVRILAWRRDGGKAWRGNSGCAILWRNENPLNLRVVVLHHRQMRLHRSEMTPYSQNWLVFFSVLLTTLLSVIVIALKRGIVATDGYSWSFSVRYIKNCWCSDVVKLYYKNMHDG